MASYHIRLCSSYPFLWIFQHRKVRKTDSITFTDLPIRQEIKSIFCGNLQSFSFTMTSVTKKVKQSLYRPAQALGFSEFEAPRFPNNRRINVVSLSAQRTGRLYSPTPHKIFLLLIFVRGWVDPRATVRLEGLCQLNIPVTISEIEPATFKLVAQCAISYPRRLSPKPKIYGAPQPVLTILIRITYHESQIHSSASHYGSSEE
jgi:hypothetical protein